MVARCFALAGPWEDGAASKQSSSSLCETPATSSTFVGVPSEPQSSVNSSRDRLLLRVGSRHASAGDVAGGAVDGAQASTKLHLLRSRSQSIPSSCADDLERSVEAALIGGASRSQKEVLLEQTIAEVESLSLRTERTEDDRRRYLESTRTIKGTIRILGRIRPPLNRDEEDDSGCLRVVSRQQLEVLTEPRALITDQLLRNRRSSTGAMGLSSRSLSALDDTLCRNSVLEPRTYFFDDIFDSTSSDEDIFAGLGDDVAAALEGEAVCILAYGATGSGKTHTMANLADRSAREVERYAVSAAQNGILLEITVQIVEIYNEHLRDLLVTDNSHAVETPRLKLSASNSSTTLVGASTKLITSLTGGGIRERLGEALRVGQAQRATCPTGVHGRSSRSHLVMILYLMTRDAQTGATRRAGKLSLVDLAGSERLKRSEAAGDRLREATHINRSLSALADVISAKERRDAHVPYRNSKLTHLLQDALGSHQQCRTIVLVALTPTFRDLPDTLHSLQFSSRLTALTYPTVAPKRSLRIPDFYEDRLTLKQEVLRWRSEFERTKAQLELCKYQLEIKRQQLQEAALRNAELETSTLSFNHSRELLLHRFASLAQRLQAVEDSTMNDATSSAPSTPTNQQRDVIASWAHAMSQQALQTIRVGGVSAPRPQEDDTALTAIPLCSPPYSHTVVTKRTCSSRAGSRSLDAPDVANAKQDTMSLALKARVHSGGAQPSKRQSRVTRGENKRFSGREGNSPLQTARGRTPGVAHSPVKTPHIYASPPHGSLACGFGKGQPVSRGGRYDLTTLARSHLVGGVSAQNASKQPMTKQSLATLSLDRDACVMSWVAPSAERVEDLGGTMAACGTPSLESCAHNAQRGATMLAHPPLIDARDLPQAASESAGPFASSQAKRPGPCTMPALLFGHSSEDPNLCHMYSSSLGVATSSSAFAATAGGSCGELQKQLQSPITQGLQESGSGQRFSSKQESVRSRSTSLQRRGLSPRTYIVEKLTPARARELAEEIPKLMQPLESVGQVGDCSTGSPALLIGPGEESEADTEEGEAKGGWAVPPRACRATDLQDAECSEDLVSVSSDEREICNRLKVSLRLLGALPAEAPTSSRSARVEGDSWNPQAAGNPGQSVRAHSGRASRERRPQYIVAHSPRSRTHQPTQGGFRRTAVASNSPPRSSCGANSATSTGRVATIRASKVPSRPPTAKPDLSKRALAAAAATAASAALRSIAVHGGIHV